MTYTPLQQREIFHLLFLEQLLRSSDPHLYVIKGGVNLRFFLKSSRYSEDMDIDVFGGAVSTLKKNGYKILSEKSLSRALKTFGIDEIIPNDPSKAKQTDTTQRFRLRLITSAGDELPTKVEFSRRSAKSDMSPALDLIDPEIAQRYQRVSFRAQHYNGQDATVQKIEALAGRAQTQSRDVFDLHLLYASGAAQPKVIEQRCGARLRSEAQKRLQALSFEDFQGQVLEFLEFEARARYDSPSIWQEMKERIFELMGNG